MRSRRGFFAMVGGLAAVSVVGGCIDASETSVGPDGAIEILPRRADLWYGNVMPAYAPAVRQSPALDKHPAMKH